MKKYILIFSILLMFILVGASCVSATEIDDSDSAMLENMDIGLSQGDNVDLNYEDETIGSNENDQVSQCETNFNEDLQEETNFNEDLQEETIIDNVNDNDELILDDPACDVGSTNSPLSSQVDGSDDALDVGDGFKLSSLALGSCDEVIVGENDVSNSLPDLVCFAFEFEDFNLFLTYMQNKGTPLGDYIKRYLSNVYQESIPDEHTNTLRLRDNIRPMNEKLIPTISSGIDITIDGQGHTIDFGGGDDNDHYILVKAGHVTFKNINFINGYNDDSYNGGALSIEGSGSCTIINCTFRNCFADDYGGAISHRSCNELVINDSTFIGNVADDDDGGAIYSNGQLTLNNCVFESNTASDGYGGAIYSSNSVILYGCRFLNNHADEDGGAIYAEGQFWGWKGQNYFEGNVAEENGGALYLQQVSSEIKSSVFVRNTASGGRGGAIYCKESVECYESAFIGNKADDEGGAFFSHYCVFTEGDIFIDNTADLGKIVYACDHHSSTKSNWYGTNNPDFDNAFLYRNPSFAEEDYKYGIDYLYVIASYELTPNSLTDNFVVRLFDSVFEKRIKYKFPINPGDVSFTYDASKVRKFEYSVNEDNTIGVTILAKEGDKLQVTARIFGREVATVNIGILNPNLSAECTDIIKGEEDSVLVEIHLNEAITGDCLVRLGNRYEQVHVSKGYGYIHYDVHDLDVGNYSFLVEFDGIGFYVADSIELPFEIKSKTSPDGVCGFVTLQNRIYDPDNKELKLDCDYIYCPESDGEYVTGVVIDKDNFVLDGQGHTIDGIHLARIFNITAKNVTLKNINFINGFAVNGGAVLFNVNGIIENCTFINNSASNNGGAVQANGDCRIEGSNFFNNRAYNAGGVYCSGKAIVNHSNFDGNHAISASALRAQNLDVEDSIFLNNKAMSSELDLTYENHRITVQLYGGNYYLNAVNVFSNVSFKNVTYWKGGIVNSDESVPTMATSGIDITIELIDYIGMDTVKNITLVTDDDGRVEFNPVDLEHYMYKVNAYHTDDNYYDYIGSTMDLTLNRISSSVAIDLEDNAEYSYPNIPDIIYFNIVNRSEESRVLITDKKGTVYLNATLTDENYVSIEGLPMGRDYYNITVFNIGNMEIEPSHDSKLFWLLKANSSIDAPEIGDFEYPHEYELRVEAENLTTFNVIIHDSEGNLVFAEENISGRWFDIPVLPVGIYNLTVINNGDAAHFESEDSTTFNITIGHVFASFLTHDVVYGNPSLFTVMVAEPGGNYTLDVNGTIAHLEFDGPDVVNITMDLPVGTYEAFLSYDNTNYEIIGVTSLTFNVLPIPNNVIVHADNVSYGELPVIIIHADVDGTYTLDVNGIMMDIEVRNNIGYVVMDLDAGDYTTDVSFNDSNYNTDVTNVEFTVYKAINDVFVKAYVLDDSPGSVDIKIIADADGFYGLDVNGIHKIIHVVNGEGYADYVLSPGIYDANVTFDNPNYDSFIRNTSFEVLPFANDIIVNVENCEDNTVVISIDTLVDGVYMINVSGDYYPVHVVDGKGNLSLSLDEGTYSLGLILNNNGLLNSVNGNNTFEAKANPTVASKKETQIIYKDMVTTAVDVDTDGRIGEYFTVTLKDKSGNALANKAVQIGFNGKVYNRTTDENGSAKLQINLVRSDIYTFAVCFLGDADYDGCFVVAKITVNKQKGSLTVPNKSYSASAKTKSLTATFKAASGKVVAGKKVTFTVNGKTYSATTNAKGVATVKVSLNKKGTYSFTAKYAGDGTYTAISKTAKLTIK